MCKLEVDSSFFTSPKKCLVFKIRRQEGEGAPEPKSVSNSLTPILRFVKSWARGPFFTTWDSVYIFQAYILLIYYYLLLSKKRERADHPVYLYLHMKIADNYHCQNRCASPFRFYVRVKEYALMLKNVTCYDIMLYVYLYFS